MSALAAGVLTGSDLRGVFAAAAAHLRESAKAVDAINVYPVPDGDTGSNMAATFAEAVDAANLLPAEATAAEVLAALAKGALYGARGNSGVILSQALKGLARGAGEGREFDAAMLAAGLREAARSAYAAVGQPEEGTMLTVLRVAAEEAAVTAAALGDGGRGVPCAAVLKTAVAAAEAAEDRTIDQLPALKEAGVTDAGGEGICVILRGLLAAVRGETPVPKAVPGPPIAMAAGHQHEAFGFCTEFLLEAAGRDVDVAAVRELAGSPGNSSVVIVGDEAALRVHVHTADPERLLAGVAAFGHVTRVKAQDMTAQNARWRATGSGASERVAVLALSRGEGFDAIFESLGAHVTDLGEVVKPPAGEIAAAIDALGAPDVIVLPNHKNVVLAAGQAASLARSTVHVVPTASLVEGIAAVLAFDNTDGAPANQQAMEQARHAVRTVEVTRAAANRSADGVSVRAGQAIALVDGMLVAGRATAFEALVAGLQAGGAASAGLITVYAGSGAAGGVDDTVTRVRAAFPGVEVEGASGGQPLYEYIASIEE
ncbi:MAG: DAK2 domain-containing protein [Chloroflexi bacterium]|nr:DAK2 domain-containing protein [Chloroflexota bacterium]